VTINYRLGALGFLSHPALQAESGTTGNYGLADQQQALRWVRDNIVPFGGDPSDVTLFGESSGGMNVISQLVSPLSEGLFRKAIVESGAFLLNTASLKTSIAQGLAFGEVIGCKDQTATCLRSKPAEDVLAKQGNPEAPPVAYELATVDGKILPMSQREAFTTGKSHHVPVLFGNNGQEGNLFVPQSLTAAEYPSTLAGYAKSMNRPVPEVLESYPLKNYATPYNGASAAYGDAYLACTDRVVARSLDRNVPAYEYEFNSDDSGKAPMGPTHGTELKYLFVVTHMGPVIDGSPATLQPVSQALSLAMRRYWTGFARRGTPDQPGVPAWGKAASGAVQVLVGSEPRPTSAAKFIEAHKCTYWN
jgi:para-nitrobenzyl esterase